MSLEDSGDLVVPRKWKKLLYVVISALVSVAGLGAGGYLGARDNATRMAVNVEQLTEAVRANTEALQKQNEMQSSLRVLAESTASVAAEREKRISALEERVSTLEDRRRR